MVENVNERKFEKKKKRFLQRTEVAKNVAGKKKEREGNSGESV